MTEKIWTGLRRRRISISARLAWTPLSLLLLSPAVLAAGQIRVLAIGQVMPGDCPISLWFDADPLVDYVLVPTKGISVGGSDLDWQRAVRLYFPKTREALTEGFDFLAFPDGRLDPFTPSQIADMKYAVENGLGALVTMGGGLSNPGGSVYPSWSNAVLKEILPVELSERMKADSSVFTIRIVKDDPPVLSAFKPLGIETIQGSQFSHLTTRQGATVWGRLKVVAEAMMSLGLGKETDWLISWRVGPTGGIFWAVADDLDARWWSSVLGPCENEYAGDVFLNILLHSTGASLPQDILQVHRLRRLYFDYNVERSLLIGLLDFIDGFGANTQGVYLQMDEVDRLRLTSFDKYRACDFAAAKDIMESAMSRFAALTNDALHLKERALLWIYLTQWVAVTGTLLACGFVLWTLMVRRRLYREVATTRLGVPDGPSHLSGNDG